MVKTLNEISKLTDKILDEAKTYAAEAEQSVERATQSLMSQFETEAEKEAQQVTASANTQAEAILRRAKSQAGIEQRNMKLAARRQSIDTAFVRAGELLRDYPTDKLTDFLVKLALECQTSDAQLIWGTGDRAIAQAVVERVNAHNEPKGMKLTLADETGTFDGGFVLKEGSIETNCTFPVLIGAVVEELEAQVADTLLG